MESCGEGGQRLPPDGDEFPAAYHEFVLGPMRSSSGADVKRPHHQQQQSLHCLGPSRDPPRTAAELLNDPEPESQRPTMALPPPPLPSSAPPSSAQPQQQQQHQESGSSCWRQDNRSERSVRDKIAMFTSQAGGVEAPLFPSPHPPARRPPQQGPKTQPRASLAAPTKPTTTTPAVIGSASNGLTRATSFSGLANGAAEAGGYPARQQHLEKPQPLARTNSLASTFSRPAAVDENARRSSLSQLIEQRRKGMSKLRGLVIPEKDALASLSSAEQQPIVDLPEIRSRDSILNNQQATRSVSLQQQYSDVGSKWGSQGSLSSPTRSVYVASSFKMPAPKILSSYSPAFKRKSLAVYGSGTCSTSPPPPPSPQSRPSSKQSSSSSSSNGGQQLASPDLAPKSLESICSPTRSDYSFEFAGSPTLMLGCSSSPPNAAHPTSAGPRLTNGAATGAARPSNGSAKQTTLCYHDDSDNDSAVSSSQSSISRGFSPPASPVPSDRSTLSSSERSYLSSCGEAPSFPGVQQQSSNAPSRTAQRQQQSVESQQQSLSRRVLKPQSVEAINRKNILASARCRSGRDQNVGSPLIQRKFDPDEEADDESGERHRSPPTRVSNGCHHRQPDDVGDALVDGADGKPQIKIAYIEIADETLECEQPPPPPRLPPKRNLPSHHNYSPIPSSRLARVEAMEPSNDMKSWVRSEIRSLRNSADSKATPIETITPITNGRNFRSRSTLALNESNPDETERDHVDAIRPKSRLNLVGSNKSTDDHDDLLAVLTTKSRSRSAIHVEDTSYGKLKSQMSLEDMLGTSGSTTTSGCKLPRSQSVIESNGVSPFSLAAKATMATATSPATRDERSHRFRRSDSTDSWSEDRTAPYSSNASRTSSFVRSGCDTGGRASSGLDDGLELALENGKLLNGAAPSRIPMPRNLGRRSASVTDMKKVFERAELGGHNATISSTPSHLAQSHAVPAAEHSRFPSLDSSLSAEEGSSLGVGSGGGASMGLRPSGSASQIEHERFNGEQFGSISSLASSTSLISQQELAQLVEEANLEEPRGGHDVVVVLLHKENPAGGVGIILAGGSDCESKEISVHRVLCHSIADKEGSVQRGDRILSINGRSMRGLSHRESLAVLKQPRSELVLVVSRPSAASSARPDEALLGSCASSSVLAQQQHQHRNSAYSPTTRLHAVADSHEDLAHHGFEASNGLPGNSAWGPPVTVTMYKDGAGLGFSLEGGRDSPLGDRPLLIKKIFTGGAAEKTGALRAGDQLLEVNKRDVSRMSRIEAWSFMKKLSDGEVNLLVRHPATKSS